MITKKKQPYARCVDCNAFFDMEFINQSCPSCKNGFVKSELRPNTWFECQVCDAAGLSSGGTICHECKGKGWLFTAVFYGGY